jgi:hypothetical protein
MRNDTPGSSPRWSNDPRRSNNSVWGSNHQLTFFFCPPLFFSFLKQIFTVFFLFFKGVWWWWTLGGSGDETETTQYHFHLETWKMDRIIKKKKYVDPTLACRVLEKKIKLLFEFYFLPSNFSFHFNFIFIDMHHFRRIDSAGKKKLWIFYSKHAPVINFHFYFSKRVGGDSTNELDAWELMRYWSIPSPGALYQISCANSSSETRPATPHLRPPPTRYNQTS